VKLLLDENLSRKLVVLLAELYPGAAHVAQFGLLASPDLEVWEFAKAKNFVIVSTDADFYELATTIRTASKGRVAAALDAPDKGCRKGTAARGHPDNGFRCQPQARPPGAGPRLNPRELGGA
jgi:hypothetical protein